MKKGKRFSGGTQGLCKYLALVWCLMMCVTAGAGRASATTLYGIRGAAQVELVRFESGAPGIVTSIGNISGLLANERILGMDYSVPRGRMFALGSTSHLYKIDLATAQAQLVSQAAFTPPVSAAGAYGFECDRVSSEARIVGGSFNGRVNLLTGAYISSGNNTGAPIYGLAQPVSGSTSFFYGINYSNDTLVSFSDIATGAFGVIGTNLGVTGGDLSFGFDIAPDGVAYLGYRVNNSSNLYTVNLATGSANPVGPIGDGTSNISSLAVAAAPGPSTIVINDNVPASPYPSALTLSGYANVPLSRVRVRLNGFSHSYPDEVRILLESPSGTNIVLMSGAGDFTDAAGLDLVFDDAAAAALPSAGALASGTYKPSAFATLANVAADAAFPTPAPAPSGQVALSAFNGQNPNGVWKLWVYDSSTGDFGQISNGWSLLIDQAPSLYDLSATSYTVSEGAGSATVTINRTGNTASADRVSLISAQGSATSTVDYTPLTQNPSIAFAPGEASKSVSIPIINDNLAEGEESFTVILRPANDSPFSSTIGSSLPSARVTITDDDGLPVISVPSISFAEGAPGSYPTGTFTATLDKPSASPVSFKYGVAFVSGEVAGTGGTISFAPGATSATFSVTSIGDDVPEPDKTYTVSLSDPVGATLASNATAFTVTNDDAPKVLPVLAVANAQVAEGAPGQATPVAMQATLSAPSALPVSFKYLALPGLGASAATQGEDFVASSGTVTFAPGTTSATFSVVVLGDAKPEPTEEVVVSLSDVSGATLVEAQPGVFLNAARLLITDDDAAVSISSLAPAQGKVGTVVAISGTGLQNAKVFFNGVAATVASATAAKVTATVPKGATTGPVRVEAAAGTAVSAAPFRVLPTISAALSTGGTVNTTFYIAGDSLSDVTGVKIGTANASFTRISNALLRVVVPLNAVTGAISVTSPGGTTTTASKFVVLPVLNSFTPAKAVAGAKVVLKGSGFSGVSKVLFGNGAAAVPASFVVNSPNQVTATVPPLAPTGVLSVVTPPGRAISRGVFTILPSAGAFTPARGSVGTQVTLNGSGFVGVKSVTLNGVAVSFRVVSATQITFVVPRGASTGKVAVTTASGQATTVGIFTVASAPAG